MLWYSCELSRQEFPTLKPTDIPVGGSFSVPILVTMEIIFLPCPQDSMLSWFSSLTCCSFRFTGCFLLFTHSWCWEEVVFLLCLYSLP